MTPLRTIDSISVGEDVIDKLEQALERARAGEVSMVAIAIVERDGSTGRTWSELHNAATLLGALDLMKAEIAASFLE